MDGSSSPAAAAAVSVSKDLNDQTLRNNYVYGVGDNAKNIDSQNNVKLKLEELKWDHSFVRELPVFRSCYTKVSPSAEVDNPQLVAWSDSVAELLDLDPKEMPYAQCYGGHQFGMWAGQLGDGRAITLGEVLNSKSQRWELQLKGAGRTPYSRFADGLAVLRSSIREFLCSEAIHSLGIPTTRALCLVTTGKFVTRDMFYDGNPKDEPGAIVCRVAQSFLRFGSYQLHASRGKDDMVLFALWLIMPLGITSPLENLSKSDSLSFSTGEGDDSVVDLTSNKYAAWAVEVAERTASLIANWQGVGFTHGVLNTDNMSVLGLTIDYGPFGFLDAFDPSYTPNTTDLPGRRYCFANQPDIGLWNIAQFATTISAAQLINDKEANYAMERYGTKFMDEYQAIMTKKLGLPKYNKQLISELLRNMAVDKVDYTNFFRLLSNIKADPTIPEDELLIPLKAVLLDIGKERKDAWTSWVKSYVQELSASGISDEERKTAMNSVNPKYILRNYLCQSAIDAAEQATLAKLDAECPSQIYKTTVSGLQPILTWTSSEGKCIIKHLYIDASEIISITGNESFLKALRSGRKVSSITLRALELQEKLTLNLRPWVQNFTTRDGEVMSHFMVRTRVNRGLGWFEKDSCHPGSYICWNYVPWLAFNADPDLSYFKHIAPVGLQIKKSCLCKMRNLIWKNGSFVSSDYRNN
ncbi:protein adenylyltransferase SelO [Sesamum angolense]|uniref:Selenoprotein O n=1 Tax=Sesamum angolense TaxID=2727404 RepID=A0AAE2C408_9LAMI|nr:protein adenylyltransferase SelO [Sesamum angolense]